jgi:type IV pilus assembly protein PilB
VNPDDLIKYLLRKRFIQPEQAREILEKPGSSRGSIEQTLIENGIVQEDVLLQAMARVYGLPYYELDSSLLDVELASTLPQRMLKTFCVYPLRRETGSKVVPLAMADPFDVSVIDTFRYITGYQIQPVIASRQEIEGAISGVLLGRHGLRRIAEQVPWDEALDVLQEAPEPELESEHSRPIIFLVNSLLRGAVQAEASDIHLEPQENEVRVRFRVDGILQEVVSLPKRVSRACVARIKIMESAAPSLPFRAKTAAS